MTFQIDQTLSIYIPRINQYITEQYIKDVFSDLNIGVVSRVDVVDIPNKAQNSAYVHFSEWNNTDVVSMLQCKIKNPNQQAKIVYNSPWFWFLLPNTSPDADGVLTQENDTEKPVDIISVDTDQQPTIEIKNIPSTPTCSYASVLERGVLPSCPRKTKLVDCIKVQDIGPTDDEILELIAEDCDAEYECRMTEIANAHRMTEVANDQLRTIIEDLQIRLAQCEQLSVNTAAKQECLEFNMYANN